MSHHKFLLKEDMIRNISKGIGIKR